MEPVLPSGSGQSAARTGWPWPQHWAPPQPLSLTSNPVYRTRRTLHAEATANGDLYVWEGDRIVRIRCATGHSEEFPHAVGAPMADLPRPDRLAVLGPYLLLATQQGFLAVAQHDGAVHEVASGTPRAQMAFHRRWIGLLEDTGGSTEMVQAQLVPQPPPAPPPGSRLQIDAAQHLHLPGNPDHWSGAGGRPVILSRLNDQAHWVSPNGQVWRSAGAQPPEWTGRAIAGSERLRKVWVWDAHGALAGEELDGSVRIIPPGQGWADAQVDPGPLRACFQYGSATTVVADRCWFFAGSAPPVILPRPRGAWCDGVLTYQRSRKAPTLLALTWSPETRASMLTTQCPLSGRQTLLWRAEGVEARGLLPAGAQLYLVHEGGLLQLTERQTEGGAE